jgi:hypothetical protein
MTLDTIIREAEAAMEFGTVTMTLKKKDGVVKSVDMTRISSNKVDGNTQALTMVGTMLKLLCEAKETGDLTFTITLMDGESDRVLTHDFRRVRL